MPFIRFSLKWGDNWPDILFLLKDVTQNLGIQFTTTLQVQQLNLINGLLSWLHSWNFSLLKINSDYICGGIRDTVFYLGKKDKSVNQLNFQNLSYHLKEAQNTHPWGQKGEVHYYILIPVRTLSFIIKNRLASDHKYFHNFQGLNLLVPKNKVNYI